VLAKLRRARLIYEPNPDQPDALDAHPVIREYFRKNLIEVHPAAWREGNDRLFSFFSDSAKQLPENIWEMQPLKMAIMHGCRAGRHRETLKDIYSKRVRRGSEDFITENLGAHGENLVMLSNFFDIPRLQPAAELSKESKSFVLNQTALSLQALGRLVEAAQTIRSELISNVASEDQKEAAISAGNLSEIYLTIGNLVQALSYAQYSVDLADRSGDPFERMSKRTTLAYTLQQSGQVSEAKALFNEAEQIQKASKTPLASPRQESGLHHLNMLLAAGGEGQQVQQQQQSKLSESRSASDKTLDIAIEHLSLGHTYMLRAKQGKGNYAHAEAHLNQALNTLRQAGPHHHLPIGLLIRAELYTLIGSLDQALTDIDEALSIATRGDMGLHLVDAHLAYARVYLAKGEKDKAEDSLIVAKKLIERTGYHWRDESVAEIEKQIAEAEQKSK
jgi:tetratricopeptide (TPR) repeat protein